ncbi:MAG TPA: hypothetical protein PLC07_01360 [Bacillota bacterium]|nr:hypothetical protein [Bacillota bacterium]
MIIRVALTNRRTTPELYQIIRIIGEKRVRYRLERCLEMLK